MISVLILTRNEEKNLPRCLEAVSWSDDVLVLDSFSDDRTFEIARAAGARVMQRAFDNFASQRNYGLECGRLKHDWVLHLDADELVTSEFRDELFELAHKDRHDAYRVPSKMMFMGRWLKYSGMYPTYQVRFGKKDRLGFIQVGHGQRETLSAEAIGTMSSALLHYSFSKGLDDWFEKHNRYSTAEARHAVEAQRGAAIDWAGLFAPSDRTRRRRALKQLSSRLPFRPLLRFLYMYLFRLGFLDGWPGYTYCRLLAIYEYMIVLKSKELSNSGEMEVRSDPLRRDKPEYLNTPVHPGHGHG